MQTKTTLHFVHTILHACATSLWTIKKQMGPETKPNLPWSTLIILHTELIQHLVSGQADIQQSTNVGKDSYNSDCDFWFARTVTIQMVIFGLQGQLNSGCNFWFARTVTIQIVIFGLQGQL